MARSPQTSAAPQTDSHRSCSNGGSLRCRVDGVKAGRDKVEAERQDAAARPAVPSAGGSGRDLLKLEANTPRSVTLTSRSPLKSPWPMARGLRLKLDARMPRSVTLTDRL